MKKDNRQNSSKSKNNLNDKKLFSFEKINNYVLSQYNLFNSDITLIKFKNTEKERAIYKISNNNHYYSLKKVYYSEKELLFIYSALEWLYRHNINVPKLLKTTSNNRFAQYNNMIFILTPWLDGEKCNFDNMNHLNNSIKALANLHNAGLNFRPIYGSKINSGYNNQYIITLKHFEELNRISTIAYNSTDCFSKYYINNFDNILLLSELSLKISSSIINSELSKSLTHGDYVNKNILINNNNVSIIDFDKCKYDYTVHDISYFLRRLLKRRNTKWNINICINLLKVYDNIKPLSQSELKYIISYICFPQKCYKLTKAYYDKSNYYSTKSSLVACKRNKIYSKEEIEISFSNCIKLLPYQIHFAKKIINYFEANNWKL